MNTKIGLLELKKQMEALKTEASLDRVSFRHLCDEVSALSKAVAELQQLALNPDWPGDPT